MSVHDVAHSHQSEGNVEHNPSLVDQAKLPDHRIVQGGRLRVSEQLAKLFPDRLATGIRSLIDAGTVSSLLAARSALRAVQAALDVVGVLHSTVQAPAEEPEEPEEPNGEQPQARSIFDHPFLKATSTITLGMAVWFWATGKSQEKEIGPDYYPLPAALNVEETTLPHQQIVKNETVVQEDGTTVEVPSIQRSIDLSSVDLSGEFEIVTDRYRIIKEKDFIGSRLIGHLASIPMKLYYWDGDIGWGLDENRTKSVISMLEANKDISGLTVRINNNGVLQDTCRLFFDEEVCERNNFIARVAIGIPTTFFGEMFSELRRGDYYNPMTQTVVLYSDVSAISAHEIGHHQDFERFDSDWWYVLSRGFPPAMLYQEAQASLNARELIDPKDDYQFVRHLLPGFATYLLASYYLSKHMLASQLKRMGRLTPETFREISAEQVVRHMVTSNAQLYSGIMAYGSLLSMGAPGLVATLGFGGAFLGAGAFADGFWRDSTPYPHEE